MIMAVTQNYLRNLDSDSNSDSALHVCRKLCLKICIVQADASLPLHCAALHPNISNIENMKQFSPLSHAVWHVLPVSY